jgi:hypothetical protein
MSKLERLRHIIDAALQGAGKSKLTNEIIDSVGGYISPNNRHLLNNLGAISTHYYEIGSHVGSSLISTVYGNNNLESATGCDNFSLFNESHNAKNDFIDHCGRIIPNQWTLLEKDCFTVTKADLPNKIDLFFSDGAHDFESQRKAITYTEQFLADEAIIVVDDFSWPEPNGGTMKGLKESGLEIVYAATLDSGIRSDCSGRGFWNGIGIFLVRK